MGINIAGHLRCHWLIKLKHQQTYEVALIQMD
jgi:hypothetical protein